jgi:hypothetical protein
VTRPLPLWVCEEHFEIVQECEDQAEARELHFKILQEWKQCAGCTQSKEGKK